MVDYLVPFFERKKINFVETLYPLEEKTVGKSFTFVIKEFVLIIDFRFKITLYKSLVIAWPDKYVSYTTCG
jgi:hypothetical protein